MCVGVTNALAIWTHSRHIKKTPATIKIKDVVVLN
jgi:hypothetical protein